MAFSIRIRKGSRCLPGPGRTPTATPERPPSRRTPGGQEKPWPAETEMWLWTQNAILFGYGPPPSAFL